MPLDLHRREYGNPSAAPVLLLHGLFGSATNWHGIARRLQDDFRLIVPDLRGHGRSRAEGTISYQEMAQDLIGLLDEEGIAQASIVGHSMGGKTAMWLALTHADRVRAIAVVDIAPTSYEHGFDTIIDALTELDIGSLRDRRDADARLSASLPDPALRGFLLQNLVPESGAWRWRLDLAALRASMDEITGFPDLEGHQFPGPAFFIYGTESDYVTGASLPAIRARFPLARLRSIPQAGHWVYADQPEAFAAALKGFLGRT